MPASRALDKDTRRDWRRSLGGIRRQRRTDFTNLGWVSFGRRRWVSLRYRLTPVSHADSLLQWQGTRILPRQLRALLHQTPGYDLPVVGQLHTGLLATGGCGRSCLLFSLAHRG